MVTPANILSLGNLKAAIHYWRNEKPNWDQDFHNNHYRELERMKGDGLTEKWWAQMVDRLSYWRALRPKTKAYIYERGVERLNRVEVEYENILVHLPNKSAGIDKTNWRRINGLFTITAEIKDVESPVFPSKMCHFILPNMYPVIDWDAVGVRTYSYRSYWEDCAKLWKNCNRKDELIELLADAIRNTAKASYLLVNNEPIDGYPWSTKITELCLIGARHPMEKHEIGEREDKASGKGLSFQYEDKETDGIMNRIRRFLSGNGIDEINEGEKEKLSPKAVDFQEALDEIFHEARLDKKEYVDILSGDLHRRVGGYPGTNHRMPTCCDVMYKNMKPKDIILEQPAKGKGAKLLIRYGMSR